MADCLAERVVLTRDVLAFRWMAVTDGAGGQGLMAVTWVRWVVSCLADSWVRMMVALGVCSRAGWVAVERAVKKAVNYIL